MYRKPLCGHQTVSTMDGVMTPKSGVKPDRSCARHNGLTELDLTDPQGGRTHRASPFPKGSEAESWSGSLRENVYSLGQTDRVRSVLSGNIGCDG